jgi:phosphoribosylanthranilate isomerase
MEITSHVGLTAVQLHGFESVADTRWVASRARWTIKAFPAGHTNIGRFDEYGADLLLIDGSSPGSGELFDWRLAEGVADPGRLIVSGGLRPENVGAAISHLHPWGVDVSSGVEASPGVKDPVKLREFITAAHDAARQVAAVAEEGSGTPRSAEVAGDSEEPPVPFDWQDD